MKDRGSLFILLFIIILLIGFIFLRRSGILTINKSTNENSGNFLDNYYEGINSKGQPLPNVQDTVNEMQVTKR